jgi:UDP-MurNAc hydroxylase
MRATSIGHAGMLIETDAGSIVCDPWFVPAFFGSWFVFPRNDQLSDDLRERIENADFLYISHLHGDHHDEPWLREHLRRDIPILLPGFPTREQQRTLQALGFTEFVRTVDTEELEIAPGLTVAIHVETSITDGPGGDSALVVSDGTSILVNQNDCRTNDLAQLRAHGPVDLHWLQFSGAIWYPMVYEMPDDEKRRLCEAKVSAQFARAMRYVENIDARYVVPSAGPPAFLDDDLFALNMIDGDELSIFPDQTEFLRRLAEAGRHGVMNIPGTTIDLAADADPDGITVTHPIPLAEVEAIFSDKRTYLEGYRADWKPWLDRQKASWNPASTDLLTTLREWWEPLLEMAPTLRSQVGANVLVNAGDLPILVDFPSGEVRRHDGEPYSFRFDIPRELVETVVAQRAVDWSNSLLLSCRFTAWREGEFNEYVYNFLKSLSRERMRRAEAEVVRKLMPVDVLERLDEPDIRIGDHIVQRRCPHRNADLAAFGEIDGCDFVCTLHGWRFDLETGRNKTASDQPLRIRRATDAD